MFNSLRWPLFAALVASGLAGPSAAAAEKRVALVVGNAAYTNISALQKPINDAQRVAEILRGLGFQVIFSVDASKRELDRLVQQFQMIATGADVGFFFYSGHGFQTNRANQQHPVNHIVPVDFKVEDADPMLATLALDVVIETLKRNARVGFIFMDACRNDPQLAAASARIAAVTRSLTMSRGFSPVNITADRPLAPKQGGRQAPTGLFIAYATDPGNVAFEGERGPLSPFTTALVKHIVAPGLNAAEVMGKVSFDVSAETQGQQTPWNVSSLTAASYQFVPRTSPPTVPSQSPKGQTIPAKVEPKQKVPFQLQ